MERFDSGFDKTQSALLPDLAQSPDEPMQRLDAFEDLFFMDGLAVDSYDLFTESVSTTPGGPLAGDVEFYLALARRTGGPVLELGVGTGRIAWPLADAGFDVVGIDRSDEMIARAVEKGRERSTVVRARLTFSRSDMCAIDLGCHFALGIIPHRAFQHLLTNDKQRQCLTSISKCLLTGGVLAVHMFDFDPTTVCERGIGTLTEVVDPKNGGTIRRQSLRQQLDHERRCVTEVLRFERVDEQARVIQLQEVTTCLRWTERGEMRQLLQECGFIIEDELSSFKATSRKRREQIWLARKRD